MGNGKFCEIFIYSSFEWSNFGIFVICVHDGFFVPVCVVNCHKKFGCFYVSVGVNEIIRRFLRALHLNVSPEQYSYRNLVALMGVAEYTQSSSVMLSVCICNSSLQ
jgi:hypothetical protein